jgi:hypothetical protein
MTAPDCWALGEVPSLLAPPDIVKAKQSETCATCVKNAFGSCKGGTLEGGSKKGKACANTRLLALIPPDSGPEAAIWLITVSPTAIRGFDAYVAKCMAEFRTPPVGVISTIAFDPAFDFPSLRFGNARPNPILDVSIGMMETARQRLLTPPDYEAMEKRAVTPAPVAANPGRSSARVSR